MSAASNLRGFAIVFLLVFLNSGCDKGAENTLGAGGAMKDLSIGRMKVSIMPEYDDPSVLAIYDGRFEEVSSYPIKTSFLIPKGSVISDACSLSHEGQHFCQLYKTINRGNYDEVSILLPYPNFYLSFHTPQLDVKIEKKAIEYQIRANHPIKTMEIDIQQPLRSTEFSILPAENAAVSQKDGSISLIKGFNHVIYRLENVAKNQENTFTINYVKSDPKPSVDIKYTSMKEPQTQTTSYETQRSIKTIIYALFGTGAFGMIALVAWYFRSRKKKPGKLP